MAIHAGHVDLVQALLEGIRTAEAKMRAGAEEFKELVGRLQSLTGTGSGKRGKRRGRPPGSGAKRGSGKRKPHKGSLPSRVLDYLEARSGHHTSAALLAGLGLPKKKRQQLASTLSHLKRDRLLKHVMGKGYTSAK